MLATKNISDLIATEPVEFTTAINVPREEYTPLVGLNPSSLSAGLVGHDAVNPTAIKMAWESPDAIQRTAASQDRLDRGTLAHLIVLQPELLMDRVKVWSGGRRAGSEWDQFQDEYFDKLIIRAEDYADVSKAVNAMRSIPMVAEKFHGIESEVAITGTEISEANGNVIRVKGQVDGVNRNAFRIVDLKTTEAGIDKRAVERTIRSLHYREKMALYRRWLALSTGTRPDVWQCYNVFMSLVPPYGVITVKFSSMALDWGEARMMDAIDSVDRCLASGEWPIYCREIFMNCATWELDDDEELDYGQ